MTRNKIMVYNPDILKKLKETYPYRWDKIKSNQKELWLSKKTLPTYKQLVEISKIFNIPFGYLFLEELPEKRLPIPYFRTEGNFQEYSDELYDTVMLVSKLQIWAKEILEEWGHSTLHFAGKYNKKYNKKEIINEMKLLLNLKEGWASQFKTWYEAFKYLTEKLEELGIFVVINGVVGNNTHRSLDVNEFRGFVLYDHLAPFIFVNNNDFISAKIFTLIHEFVHILIGESASFDLKNLIPANNHIEKFCNECTAEFLVPENELKNIKIQDPIDFEVIAKQFKVSQIVIARRLLDIGYINQERFIEFYNDYKNKIYKRKESKGDNFYKIAEYRYSKRFLNILKYALESETIFLRDLYQLLDLNQKTIEKLLKVS